jgi:glycine/D-amino acid oxidase-like deaminating enzyme
MGNRLNPAQRQQHLNALANEDFDVVVIGGGVTGAGVALDAASRGLKTAVIEAQDWAAGASGRTSRLVVGGLRYLYLCRHRGFRPAHPHGWARHAATASSTQPRGGAEAGARPATRRGQRRDRVP